jgi:hypothetical protein
MTDRIENYGAGVVSELTKQRLGEDRGMERKAQKIEETRELAYREIERT